MHYEFKVTNCQLFPGTCEEGPAQPAFNSELVGISIVKVAMAFAGFLRNGSLPSISLLTPWKQARAMVRIIFGLPGFASR